MTTIRLYVNYVLMSVIITAMIVVLWFALWAVLALVSGCTLITCLWGDVKAIKGEIDEDGNLRVAPCVDQ